MSIVTAKELFQDAIGTLGTVVSGTMTYERVEKGGKFEQEEVYLFKVKMPGESQLRRFSIRVAVGENWQQVIRIRGAHSKDALARSPA